MKTLVINLSVAFIMFVNVAFADHNPTGEITSTIKTVQTSVLNRSNDIVEVNIEKNANDVIKVCIYDAQGNEMSKRTVNEGKSIRLSHDLSNLPTGIYTLKIIQDNNVITEKTIEK